MKVTGNHVENVRARSPSTRLEHPHAKSELRSILVVVACSLLAAVISRAADISGQWRAEFDTQIGQQKYLFDFHVADGKVTTKATAELGGQKREVEFKDTKLADDTLTFVEMFKFQG